MREREILMFDTFVDFLPVDRFESRSDMRELGSFNNCTSKSPECDEAWIAVSWGDCNIVSCSNHVWSER